MSSPTQRSLALMRERGFDADIVERWISFTGGSAIGLDDGRHRGRPGVRKDLFGIVDIVAMRVGTDEQPEHGFVGVQACAASSHSARKAKALQEDRLRTYLEAGRCRSCGEQVVRFALVSWRKHAKPEPGSRKLWRPRIETLTLEDLDDDRPF